MNDENAMCFQMYNMVSLAKVLRKRALLSSVLHELDELHFHDLIVDRYAQLCVFRRINVNCNPGVYTNRDRNFDNNFLVRSELRHAFDVVH